MYVKMKTEKGIVNVVSVYAPQVGCMEEEKDTLDGKIMGTVTVKDT